MEENDDKPAWKKCDTGFSLSASTPMQGCEIYLPEPLGTTHAIVVVTVTTNSEFRVVFNCEPTPSRSTGKPVLCFVVGQDGNSRTTVREGNPGVILAETKEKRALLTSEKEQQTAFWFSFDVSSQIAAFGLGNHPGSDSTLLVVPDWCGCFEKTKCRLFIGVANWTQPLHLFLSQHHTSGLGLNSYPHKFNDDKTIKPFDGVTCICRVNEKSHGAFIHKALVQAQEILKATGPTVGGCFSFLPPDSFHMTLTDLVTSRNRLTVCPKIKGDMRQVGEELRQRSKEIMSMAASNIFYMKLEGVHVNNSLSVWLRPYEVKTAEAMAAWRELMYTSLGFPYSKNYEFHITLAYRILPINESDARALLSVTAEKIHNMLIESRQLSLLPIGVPELCTFEDMSAFHKI
ncbi:unnamed protein product [Rotaria magnacalcarata]|uniref:DUF1868 domain-containing protein n=1 Tax=Rotaria magnacalcarata TaxID=392030 RepID=A0A816X630_9BILA|nr:unnamed protein product [Rotaria magnacalcarata]